VVSCGTVCEGRTSPPKGKKIFSGSGKGLNATRLRWEKHPTEISIHTVVNPNFGKTNHCVSRCLPHIYLDISILACFCHIGGATWLLVFVKCRHSIFIKELILKPYTKCEFKTNKQTRRRRRGESLPWQTRWHQFWAVRLFRCEGTSLEILELSPEILDFPETPEKSPEYPGFTDKFVLSGDFQDSPINPPSW
jgi:hypothetical protein